MLLNIRFLNPLYHGEKTPGVPEWPPSPYRLFQAMLAGVHARQPLPLARSYEVLRWLEAQPSPTISAVGTGANNPLTVTGSLNQTTKRLITRGISQVYLREPMTVQYHWPVEAGEYAEDLQKIASSMVSLGRGVDRVIATLSGGEPDEKLRKWWVNSRMVGNQLRVPLVGTLDDLLASYQFKVDNPQCPRTTSVYDFATYVTDRPQRHVVFKIVDHEGKFEAISPQMATEISAWVRHVAVDASRMGFPGDSETYVAGHCKGRETLDRFSYVPLPSIGHRHSDGMIRRVAVVAGPNDDGSMAAWASRALNGATLTDDQGRFRGVLVRDDVGDGVLDMYTRPNRVWRSVTPVVLPWKLDPTAGIQDVEDIFRWQIFPQAGLDVQSFAIRREPWLTSMPMRGYFLPSYLRQKQLWHVAVELRKEQAGLVALGAGRFRGIGVMACAA